MAGVSNLSAELTVSTRTAHICIGEFSNWKLNTQYSSINCTLTNSVCLCLYRRDNTHWEITQKVLTLPHQSFFMLEIPQFTALSFSLWSSYCYSISPCSVPSALFFHFWFEWRSHASHTNPFPVLKWTVHYSNQMGNLRNLWHYRPVIQIFRIGSQNDRKGTVGLRTGFKFTSINIRDFDSNHFSKRLVMRLFYNNTPLWQCWLWPCNVPLKSILEDCSLMGAFWLFANQGCLFCYGNVA